MAKDVADLGAVHVREVSAEDWPSFAETEWGEKRCAALCATGTRARLGLWGAELRGRWVGCWAALAAGPPGLLGRWAA